MNMSPSPGLPGITFFLISYTSHLALYVLLKHRISCIAQSYLYLMSLGLCKLYSFFSKCSSSTIYLVNSCSPIKTPLRHNLLEKVFLLFLSLLCLMEFMSSSSAHSLHHTHAYIFVIITVFRVLFFWLVGWFGLANKSVPLTRMTFLQEEVMS